MIGGVVGSLALILALVALCKWDPVHKRLPFDPFLLFSTNDSGRFIICVFSAEVKNNVFLFQVIARAFLNTNLDRILPRCFVY